MQTTRSACRIFATKLGRATVDVTVRDPVVLTATLPRFLLNGDHGTMSFDLDNVEGAPGDYTVSVKTSGPVKVSGNPVTSAKLAAKQRSSMSLALDAGGAGSAALDVDIKGPNGLTLARHYALDVKPATQILTRRSIRTLADRVSVCFECRMRLRANLNRPGADFAGPVPPITPRFSSARTPRATFADEPRAAGVD